MIAYTESNRISATMESVRRMFQKYHWMIGDANSPKLMPAQDRTGVMGYKKKVDDTIISAIVADLKTGAHPKVVAKKHGVSVTLAVDIKNRRKRFKDIP